MYRLAAVNKKALLSFVIFILVFLKDLLVSGLHVIRPRSMLNFNLTYFFVVPASLIGVVLSILIVKDACLQKKNNGIPFFDINVKLALPLLLYISFFIAIGGLDIIYYFIVE